MSRRTLYTIMSLGVIGTFIGHGMWAVRGEDKFVALLTGSLDHVFGVSMSTGTATPIIRTIGAVDLAVAAAMVVLLVGLYTRGRLGKLAYSPLAIGLYGWAVFWGFTTAVSRITADGAFYPAVWDFVERAGNYFLPAALLYVIISARRQHPEAPLFVSDITEKVHAS